MLFQNKVENDHRRALISKSQHYFPYFEIFAKVLGASAYALDECKKITKIKFIVTV